MDANQKTCGRRNIAAIAIESDGHRKAPGGLTLRIRDRPRRLKADVVGSR
jgi:hypothetical protein